MVISAVIPAYNEEEHVGEVVQVVKAMPEIAEVLVIDDGSSDRTAEFARKAGATVITLGKNLGKGGAMLRGVQEAKGEVILFLDADLIGLTAEHIRDMLQPVIDEAADVVVGIFDGGRFGTDMAQLIAPYLSGQRVLAKKHLLDMKMDAEDIRFGIEVALTIYAHEKDLRVENVVLEGMSHVTKEEKLGFAKGVLARLKMYKEIATVVKKVVVDKIDEDQK